MLLDKKQKAVVIKKALKSMVHKNTRRKEFEDGINIEAEHDGRRGKGTDVVKGNPSNQAKIAMAHLNEMPDYYTRLKKMEKEADEDES